MNGHSVYFVCSLHRMVLCMPLSVDTIDYNGIYWRIRGSRSHLNSTSKTPPPTEVARTRASPLPTHLGGKRPPMPRSLVPFPPLSITPVGNASSCPPKVSHTQAIASASNQPIDAAAGSNRPIAEPVSPRATCGCAVRALRRRVTLLPPILLYRSAYYLDKLPGLNEVYFRVMPFLFFLRGPREWKVIAFKFG